MIVPQAVVIVGGMAAVGIGVLYSLVGVYERVRGVNAHTPDQVAELNARMARIEAMMESVVLELEHANDLRRLNAGPPEMPRLSERRDGGAFNTPH